MLPPKTNNKIKDWTAASSQVISVAYNEENKELLVTYKGSGTYKYKDVPLSVWEKSLGAESIGKFLNTEVKNKYEYAKN